MSDEEQDDGLRMTPFLYQLEQIVKNKLLREALKKISKLPIQDKDRIRLIFEFEFYKDKMKTAVEVRHRRPWK